jgi:APA family basic amino acid/polyamine antiporter
LTNDLSNSADGGTNQRGVSFFSAVNIVVASMIGAGVYTTSGFALADLGSPWMVLAAWAIGGLLALCGAVSYGALAQRFSQSGGEYLFLSRAIHPAAGNIAGFVSLLSGFTGAIAVAALSFEAYMKGFFDSSDQITLSQSVFMEPGVIACMVVVAAAVLHGFRVQTGMWIQDSLVVLKVIMLVAFVLFAALSLKQPWQGMATAIPRPTDAHPIVQLARSLVWILFSYTGFNAAIYITSEVKESGATVRRALWVGTLVVTALYLALNAVFVLAPPSSLVLGKPDIAAEAAGYIGGDRFKFLFRITIVISLATSVLSLMMTGPRVYAKMADDGVLPKWFRFRTEVPRAALFAQAVVAIAAIQLATLNQLLSYLGITLSLSATLTVGSLFILRYRGDKVDVPFYPWPPLIFVVGTLVITLIAGIDRPVQLMVAGGTLAVGFIAYHVGSGRSDVGSTAEDNLSAK